MTQTLLKMLVLGLVLFIEILNKMRLNLKIQPNAKKEDLEELSNGVWKLKIHAPAIDGRANDRVVEILSQIFNVAKSKVMIISGQKSKSKTVAIEWLGDLKAVFSSAKWK